MFENAETDCQDETLIFSTCSQECYQQPGRLPHVANVAAAQQKIISCRVHILGQLHCEKNEEREIRSLEANSTLKRNHTIFEIT